jgi:hypothetical protein
MGEAIGLTTAVLAGALTQRFLDVKRSEPYTRHLGSASRRVAGAMFFTEPQGAVAGGVGVGGGARATGPRDRGRTSV